MIERTDRIGVILETPVEIELAQRAVYNLPLHSRKGAFYVLDGHFAMPEPISDELQLNAQETEIVIDGLCYVLDGQVKLRDELTLTADEKLHGRWPIDTKRSLRAAKREQLTRIDQYQAATTRRISFLSGVLHGVVVSYQSSKCAAGNERRMSHLRAVNQ